MEKSSKDAKEPKTSTSQVNRWFNQNPMSSYIITLYVFLKWVFS